MKSDFEISREGLETKAIVKRIYNETIKRRVKARKYYSDMKLLANLEYDYIQTWIKLPVRGYTKTDKLLMGINQYWKEWE